ncbi:MAG: hypothetical protein J1F65_05485 [Clostridiales bacterium]|nr:hypothetical protein [Clostridiales bacterium]
MSNKFLLFDKAAIDILVSTRTFQSIEYTNGMRLVEHACGKHSSEILGDINIRYCYDGIIFSGKRGNVYSEEQESSSLKNHKLFCIDLTTCDILSEKDRPSDLFTVLQKSFRVCLKIWNRLPFGFSERIHESKSIVFPFAITDKRRIVIERSNNISRLEKRGVISPLLAYKYNAEEPRPGVEIADTTVLRKAGEAYVDVIYELQNELKANENIAFLPIDSNLFNQVTATKAVGRDDFMFWDFKRQYDNLTETQKYIVDVESIDSPLRIDGPAGTGKTISMILRAYKILKQYRENGKPIKIAFFSHSESTCERNQYVFGLYEESSYFLNEKSPQNIIFTTLLKYCCDYADIQRDRLIEKDADDAKTYQLYLVEEVLQKAKDMHKIRTLRPLMSKGLQEIFDDEKTPTAIQCALLQHEFSIQIKGRTDCTFDSYCDIESITNGLPCKNQKDKECIFLLFNDYQDYLKGMGNFDVDDVVIEAMSRLNAPIWRRERIDSGFDYLFVDEMHLFNINEQSIFHYLTKNLDPKQVPICFALDYSQAIGDRGNVNLDYIEKNFGDNAERKNYHTVFRNSPQIADFCAAIASSGTLMFQESFSNPYNGIQNNFVEAEERNCEIPKLCMYPNDDKMMEALGYHIQEISRKLQCQLGDIAVISFNNMASEEGVNELSAKTGKAFSLLKNRNNNMKSIVLASPYEINGLEFKAVILLGVDEGRVPQTAGVSDISQHFIKYSAYNFLYLTSSRAKYQLVLLGSKLNGCSSCLEHAIKTERIKYEEF